MLASLAGAMVTKVILFDPSSMDLWCCNNCASLTGLWPVGQPLLVHACQCNSVFGVTIGLQVARWVVSC